MHSLGHELYDLLWDTWTKSKQMAHDFACGVYVRVKCLSSETYLPHNHRLEGKGGGG